MIQRIQRLSRPQRVLIFILLFGGGIFLLLALFAALALQALNSAQRTVAVALSEGVTVREFAILPDDDSYPASITIGADGFVYTGSYVSGALWKIAPDGRVTELPASRDTFGAISGLAAGPDGTIYVLDRLDSRLGARGGVVYRVGVDGNITEFATLGGPDDQRNPNDIMVDARGRVYVSDWGEGGIWRYDPDGRNGQVIWQPPALEGVDSYAPTGLAYDPIHDAMIVTDPEANTIYSVAVDGQSAELLYTHKDRPPEEAPGFDGVTVTPQGVIYVTALGLNRVARLENGELLYLAGDFRGASDLEYAASRLYITNWDQFSLFVGPVTPRLPFAIDVVTLPG